jgi:hypothetical protein
MKIETKYNIGDVVFLMTDTEQLQRIVTGVLFRPNNSIIYYLTCGATETTHYELEMVSEKNIMLCV